jgi:DNA-binding ferritin-like protein
MAKSFFDKSIQMQQTQTTNLTALFTSLYQLPDKIQYCHHNTTSYAAHKALDTTYESIDDLKDSIVEKVVGYTGIRPTTISLQPLTGYNETMNNEVADEIMAFGIKLEAWASEHDYCDIENLAQEYSGAGAKLKYLLTLK